MLKRLSVYPSKPPYYPVNDEKNQKLYRQYLELAQKEQ